MHPGARRYVFERIAYGHVVAQYCRVFGNRGESHLVALGHAVHQRQAIRHHGACRQAAVVDHDGHVVRRVHADAARRIRWG